MSARILFYCGLMLLSGCQTETVTSIPTPTAESVAPAGERSEPVVLSPTPTPPEIPHLSPLQQKLLTGARSTLGDKYDDGYYAGGPPPRGRGACTDVVYSAMLGAGVNIQDEIEADISREPVGYPNLGDRNINYRRAPNLIIWFERHYESLPTDSQFEAGDIIFWSLMNDGVADHTGVVSDKPGFVIHNFPPQSREDKNLKSWKILGHFRLGTR